jgi:hypothetical protein
MEYGNKTKNKRRTGVINLNLLNDTVFLEKPHKFFNKVDSPWAQLLWSQFYSNGKVSGTIRKGGFWWSRSIVKLIHTKVSHKLIWGQETQSFYGLTCGMVKF